MKILLSIKPEFAVKIFDGTKKFEFRRTIFTKSPIRKIIVYSSSPVQMVVGEFEINQILYEDIETLWMQTGEFSGTDKESFLRYFSGKTKGYAIEIKNARKYKTPLSLEESYHIRPPQFFAYIR